MKVTRLGYPQPILNSGSGLNSGGRVPPGGNDLQVLTSNGSNGRYWGENVRRITADGSNTLLSPDVNFASGSNITFSVSSNTLRIHGQAGGGASLTVADEGTPLATSATMLDFVGAGVVASGTGATKTITIAGSGGSSGYDLDTYSIDATYGDDFTGSSLDAKWTRRNYTSGAETYQVGKNATYLRIAKTGRAAGDGYFQTAPSGDWTFAMAFVPRFFGNNALAWGLCVVNTLGTGVTIVGAYTGPVSPLLITLTTYSTYGGSYVQPGIAGTSPNVAIWPVAHLNESRKVWQYLRKSGTSYFMAISLDGEAWSPESAALTWTGTVDRVGMLDAPLGTVVGPGSAGFVDVDWFNKIA